MIHPSSECQNDAKREGLTKALYTPLLVNHPSKLQAMAGRIIVELSNNQYLKLYYCYDTLLLHAIPQE